MPPRWHCNFVLINSDRFVSCVPQSTLATYCRKEHSRNPQNRCSCGGVTAGVPHPKWISRPHQSQRHRLLPRSTVQGIAVHLSHADWYLANLELPFTRSCLMHGGTTRIDCHGDWHIFDVKLIDGFHTKVLEGKDFGMLNRFGY